MTIRPASSGRVRHIALAIAVAIIAVAALLAPARGDAQEIRHGAVVACEQEGGTLTTPGGGVIFACTFPPSIPVLEVYGNPRLLHALPHHCFAAGGSGFTVRPDENALVCLE